MDILFIYISSVIPFPGFPSKNPLSHPPSPCFYEGTPPPPTHSCFTDLASLFTGASEPSKDQGPLLSLIFNKAILCYLCGWSHGSLYVYSLVGGLVPGSSEGSGWLILLFLFWHCYPFGSFSPFSNSFIGVPVISSMVGCEHLPLYLSGSCYQHIPC